MGLETKNDIRNFVMRERQRCVSDREWKFRLRGYGFAIRDTDEGRMVTSLTGRGDLCTLGAGA
ncbi:hypothetical protein FIU85_09215 [Roseovarius sp. THAF8]|uniref:hypothetical protein n=1 Tax=Roseovarius TaxID=74030 RepID=UPI001267A60B|nr:MULTISPECIES: hypothetical protein [Roseovarius]MBY5986664.1 hypothetical protein [Roseovarius atlanticus]MBY6125304.1 hypothetical protein [Roseovarius atlanticus]MBY6150235.1 hypothetical protein [Roseovarius atlanticus]QFT97479.1 hypothetical protein FIU85_09215 [Roseovarius sp. THAF8]